jgi:GTP pyrophosphokinase
MFALHNAIVATLLVAAAPVFLQDAGFRFMDPVAHDSLQAITPSIDQDQAVLEEAKSQVQELVASLGIDATVKARVKSLLSTHRKMVRKEVGLDGISDRLAMRVRVQTEDECYRVLDALHTSFEPVDGEYDDYIAHPKPNGYRSLHTAVHVPGDIVEIQVRTHAMHEAAETGEAAHWRYKLG